MNTVRESGRPSSSPSAEKAMPVIEMHHVGTRFGKTVVHRDISLTIRAGDVLAIVGGSGSGKTTLLREMIGLLAPSTGDVRLFGEKLNVSDPEARQRLRRRFGVLFQQGALFSALNVFDNIAFPLRELRRLDEALIRDLVYLKLKMVELEPQHGLLMPAELSGGMVKRVALARALALEPELLMLDEPTSGLDPDRSAKFVQLVRALQHRLRFTVVMVTHDLDTLAALANRVVVLADQSLVADGSLEDVRDTDHPFIRSFFTDHRENLTRRDGPAAIKT